MEPSHGTADDTRGRHHNTRLSDDTSPTDRRTPDLPAGPPPEREADPFSESIQSTEIVRRLPTGRGFGNYILDPMPGLSAQNARPSWRRDANASRTTLGSTQGQAAATPGTSSRGLAEPSQDRLQQRPAALQPRPSMPAPDRITSFSRLRKPPMSRRATSTTPHRGEIFSADDDTLELEADAASRHRETPTSFSTRRRQQQAPNLSLPRLQSFRPAAAEAEEDVAENRGVPSLAVQEEDDADDDENSDREERLSLDEQADSNSDTDVSDAESFTLKDRQQAINETHPFGIRVWKPALYKKDRSIQKFAQADIHSTPGGHVNQWLLLFNLVWTVCFGWWLASFAALGAIFCLLFAAPSGREYGRVLWGLGWYLFYPFGKFVRLEKDEAYLHEDRHEGRSISEYEQWQSGDLENGRLFFGPDRNRSTFGNSRRSFDSDPSETDSLLGRGRRGLSALEPQPKRRLFGRGEWNVGRVIFFLFFYCLISPSLILVSAICWFLVFWIPMGKVTILLFDHVRRHPLALSFESHVRYARTEYAPNSSILLFTYRAVGLRYWKYTVDGTNIFLINLMAVVIFVIFDWLVLGQALPDSFMTSPAFLFTMALLSIIPLAYFIGQAVASISAQSSMGLGAAINAFFATVVEVFLYCVALSQGKAQLVEGSIVGSIFAGILFLPGISMCFGAIKRKTQRFNAKSAGVTSTMLLFAVVGAFGPTLFYQIYGTHELNCLECETHPAANRLGDPRDCRRCYFSQTPALDDRFYLEAVRPYCYLSASMLFLSYLIGLWFTLRTHAAVIWNADVEEKKHEEHLHLPPSATRAPQVVGADASGVDIRDSNLYKRILGQSLRQADIQGGAGPSQRQVSAGALDMTPNGLPQSPFAVPPKDPETVRSTINVPGLSPADNTILAREVAEIAATAATIASRDRVSRKVSHIPSHATVASRPQALRAAAVPDATEENLAHVETATAAHAGGHGHDAPNWSRTKSSVILLSATVLYAIIAEILVDTVDVVLESFAIDQKFLGITLFALVPNTAEFLNAISFAMNGNIALSMEIGSAYALQVCLLQIPCLVLFSAVYANVGDSADQASRTFSLLFPQWDMVTVILCVFLLSYVYGEGKSNYFKGSILMLTYLVVLIGHFFSGFTSKVMGSQRFDVMGTAGTYQSPKPAPSWTSQRSITA